MKRDLINMVATVGGYVITRESNCYAVWEDNLLESKMVICFPFESGLTQDKPYNDALLAAKILNDRAAKGRKLN